MFGGMGCTIRCVSTLDDVFQNYFLIQNDKEVTITLSPRDITQFLPQLNADQLNVGICTGPFVLSLFTNTFVDFVVCDIFSLDASVALNRRG